MTKQLADSKIKVGFAPGTLVHTEGGLRPIEQIEAYSWCVLSQRTQGGKQDYRDVISTVSYLDQPVYAVQIRVEGADTPCTLIVSNECWRAEHLEPDFRLQLADGRKASIHATGLVRRTQHKDIGLAVDDKMGVSIILDLSEGHIRLAGDETARNAGPLEQGEPYLTPVYNFEVEEFHTYCVGEAGIWVQETVNATLNRADSPGLDEDTLIQTPYGVCEIEFLTVGSMVLSRCEKTGLQAYRRVVRKFTYQCDESCVVHFINEKGTKSAVYTTAGHPFWVNGIGWVPACELKVGQDLEIVDPIDVTDEYRPEGQKKSQLAMNGSRWQAKVTHVYTRNNVCEYADRTCVRTVYNIEVEEFHTYFVAWWGVWVHDHCEAQ